MLGLYFNTSAEMIQAALDFTSIDYHCIVSILNRVFFYYIAYFFILARIQKV
jgi:hypothetical protein